MNGLINYLKIRYVKLHFSLEIMEAGNLPRNKASALRGGMGHALLMANCIRDENCRDCDFVEDCLVRRMMYPEMKIRPAFMQTQDNEGFMIECEDSSEWFDQGDILGFNLILFGSAIAYFTQYLQAFYNLGMMGFGKQHVHFHISRVTNTKGDILVNGTDVYKERYEVMYVSDYVRHRLQSPELRDWRSRGDGCIRLKFHSPLTLKYQGQMQNAFSSEAIMAAVERRIFILNCFEGRKENEDYMRPDISEDIPFLQRQRPHVERVKRYSGTQNSEVIFTGIKGWCDFSNVEDTTLIMLLAGELVHIGKNTSFGFGRYRMLPRLENNSGWTEEGFDNY